MNGSEQHSDDCVERGREESFSEQVSPVSNPKQVHKREGVQQHLFIEIPANDTAQDRQRSLKLRNSSLTNEEGYGIVPTTGSGGNEPSPVTPKVDLFSSVVEKRACDRDSYHKSRASQPARELRDVDYSLRDSASSYIEASILLRDERDLFRNCALELLDLLDKESAPARFEEGAEILKCGILKKKASKNPVMHWKEKYVIITIGKLIWLPISSGMREKGDITITDRMRKKQHCMSGRFADSSVVVLDENTEPRCSLNRKKNVNHVFDVIYKRTSRAPLDLNSIERLEAYVKAVASSTASATPQAISQSATPQAISQSATPQAISQTAQTAQPAPTAEEVEAAGPETVIEKHFMCQSDEERDSWLRAIRQARLGRYNDPTMWFSQHTFSAVRNLMGRAKTADEAQRILGTIVDVPLCIPVYFIQSISQGCRGPSHDPQLTQVMRDLNRETVVLGERTFQATLGDSDTYGFPSKILFLLMESIRRKNDQLMASDLIRFAREVLLHTYRSQTGGDCFDALNALLNQSNLVMIMPEQCAASKNPIRIDVTDTIPTVFDAVNREGPYVTSLIDSYFTIKDRNRSKVLFHVKATVKSVICKDNTDNPWTLELLFSK